MPTLSQAIGCEQVLSSFCIHSTLYSRWNKELLWYLGTFTFKTQDTLLLVTTIASLYCIRFIREFLGASKMTQRVKSLLLNQMTLVQDPEPMSWKRRNSSSRLSSDLHVNSSTHSYACTHEIKIKQTRNKSQFLTYVFFICGFHSVKVVCFVKSVLSRGDKTYD